MTTQQRYILSAVLLSAFALANLTFAQDDFEFGDDDFDTAGEVTGDLGDDLGAAGDDADADTTAESDGESTDAFAIGNAAVSEIVTGNPQTPNELLRAIDVLAKLERFDLAKGYLQKLDGLKLSQADLANLHSRAGSGVFVQLSGTTELNPLAAEFSRATLTAARAMRENPKRIASLIEQIKNIADADSVKDRRRIARQLVDSGPAAVLPILQEVASDPESEIAPTLRTSVALIGQPAEGPLVAILDSENAALRAESVQILGFMKSRTALPFLMRSFAASQASAIERNHATKAIKRITGRSADFASAKRFLKQVADQRYEGIVSIDVNENGLAETWIWDRKPKQPINRTFSARQIAILEAARHFETLANIDPVRDDYKTDHLISGSAAAKIVDGLDSNLNESASNESRSAKFTSIATDPYSLLRAYEKALSDGQIEALIGLAEALGRTQFTGAVSGTAGRPSPMVKGIMHANARVRFAAADAVAKIVSQAETHEFPGNSRLLETLAHFASSRGQRGILIAHPRIEVAQNMAGILAQSGFDADVVTSARDAIRRSTDSADYEFILVADSFSSPDSHQLVQLLRQNPLTAKLPIGIIARTDAAHAEMIADLHPNIITLPASKEPATISHAVRRLTKLRGSSAISSQRRSQMASVAQTHLAKLAKSRKLSGADLSRYVHQIQRNSTTHGLALRSIEILGHTGSPEAQSRLLDIANQHPLPVSQRTQAAKAFDESVKQFGIMLTQQQMKTQYVVYNESESLDAATQELLGAILDTIENRLTN